MGGLYSTSFLPSPPHSFSTRGVTMARRLPSYLHPLSNLNSPIKLNIFKATRVTHVTNSNKAADRVDHKHTLEAFARQITRWTPGTWLPSKVLLSVHLHNFYCRHMLARCRECCCQVASHNCSCNTMFLVSVVNTMSLVATLASPLSGATRPFRSIRQLVFF